MVARQTPNLEVGVQVLYGLPKKRLDNRVQICNNSSCEVEREKIFDGAPPSVRGVGVARPPSERNFYLLKVLNINDRKLKTAFLNPNERNIMEKIDMMELVRHHLIIKMRDEVGCALLWEMSISTLEEMLLEGWNDMSDELWIEINDIISFKKELNVA